MRPLTGYRNTKKNQGSNLVSSNSGDTFRGHKFRQIPQIPGRPYLIHSFPQFRTVKPWVFWHRYWSRKHGRFVKRPFSDRKKVMKRLCKKAGVRYFRFLPIRHSGASLMDGNGVPRGAIQRILGHENHRTTEIYLHSMEDSERDAMRYLKRLDRNPHTGDQL